MEIWGGVYDRSSSKHTWPFLCVTPHDKYVNIDSQFLGKWNQQGQKIKRKTCWQKQIIRKSGEEKYGIQFLKGLGRYIGTMCSTLMDGHIIHDIACGLEIVDKMADK